MPSNHYCCVPQCNSWSKRNPSYMISFHRFPEENGQKVYIENMFGEKELTDRRKVWIHRLKIGKRVTKFMKVCSRHFTETDYFSSGNYKKRVKMLKKTAIPSLHLPICGTARFVCSTSSREIRLKTRSSKNNELSVDPPQECGNSRECSNYSKEDIEAAESLISLLESTNKCDNTYVVQETKTRNADVQVNIPKISTLCDLLNSNSALISFTGLNNFEILSCLVSSVEKIVKDIRCHRLSVRERVILTLIKLKLDLTYVTLAVMFNISGELCKKYILDMLPALSAVLRATIYFPSAEEIKKNLPFCFKDFNNVRVVLDCTEICIQKPKCLCCRVRFYSQYKGHLTIKFMTGVSPAGTITFVSNAYGGRASDKIIFEQSRLIDKLNTGRDAVMVDKGFLIDEICTINRIKLIRPPFLRNKKQLSSEEALLNSKIASARVHIERVNQRIKIFKILSGKLQWSLVPKIEDIFVIACGITNLSAPILVDYRFLADGE